MICVTPVRDSRTNDLARVAVHRENLADQFADVVVPALVEERMQRSRAAQRATEQAWGTEFQDVRRAPGISAQAIRLVETILERRGKRGWWSRWRGRRSIARLAAH